MRAVLLPRGRGEAAGNPRFRAPLALESDSRSMSPRDSRTTSRLMPSAAFLIAGGVLALVAIVSRPSDLRASTRPGVHAESTGGARGRSLMIDQRPVLGELRGPEGDQTVILGGDEGVSYLQQGPGGRFYESTTDHDAMYAEPAKVMLVDLPEREW